MVVAVSVLGPFQVVADGVDVTPTAPKERAVLALLVLNKGRVVSADRLLEELWPATDANRARHTLQVRVAAIRKPLRDPDGRSRLQFVPPGYRVEVAPDEIDEHRFVSLVELARTHSRNGDVLGAAAALRKALGLWRGEPLGGVTMCADLEAEAARLLEAKVDAIEDCVDAELACGYHQALAFELERLVAQHPLRERLWAQRALALYRCGRQGDALRACNAARHRFAEDLGVEPGPALRNLERAILEQRAEIDWMPPPAETSRPALGPADQPPVRYATTPTGVSIAYQVAGDGPVDLIIIPGFTSHLDVWWAPWSGRLARRLMTFCRLIVFDKRGTGLSDRPPVSGIEDWLEDACVVLDAVGSKRAVVLGMSAGGTVGVLFAATYPERTQALILYGSQPCYLVDDDYPFGMTVAAAETAVQKVQSKWGTGVLFSRFCPSAQNDPVLREQYARFQRASASPGAAASYLRSLLQMDVRPALSLVSAPTLILHASRDATDPVQAARYMAGRIANAKLVELESADHLIWLTDALDTMVNEIQDFALGAVPSDEVGRVLTTILFVDASGESRPEIIGRLIDRYRGREARRDDGILATFDGPARAIRCASAIVAELGIDGVVRAGVHCGECEFVGEEVTGAAISIARTIAGHCPPNRVLVSQTVRDLVFGSSITFDDADLRDRSAIDGRWNTFLVTST